MKKWALVDYQFGNIVREPIMIERGNGEPPIQFSPSFTSAEDETTAIDNFRTKRFPKYFKNKAGKLVFANFLTQYETSKWKVIEVPEPKRKPKRATQMSFKDFYKK